LDNSIIFSVFSGVSSVFFLVFEKFRMLVRGSKSIKMTDYNITPPSAMMGLIKVKNLITIQFELVVLTDGVSSYALAS
ncbi:MAG: hypothetical protein JW783_13010, partial [Bacteroidales bacterium]|nr:hypothetical protein [Bacteroidales bacterium]MBN2749335.1 hypothetical protein [Bacteroidales bacterium]